MHYFHSDDFGEHINVGNVKMDKSIFHIKMFLEHSTLLLEMLIDGT